MMSSSSSSSPLVLFPLALLGWLGLGLWGAGFGHLDGGLAVGVEQRLLQRPRAALGAGGRVTLCPAPKLVLAVRSKVLLPVAGHFALVLPGVLIAGGLANSGATVPAGRDAPAVLPLRTVDADFGLLALLFLP